MESEQKIKSVAIIGAGASGTITAAALKAENCFEQIRVFERRETAGGTWIYDPDPSPNLPIHPGGLPPDVDPPSKIPEHLPCIDRPNLRERFLQTPIYNSLTTNVPDIAMSFSDMPFAYGPFVPHYIPRQYLENYCSHHQIDKLLVLNTTVEDVSRISTVDSENKSEKWNLTLRRYDTLRDCDVWWEEVFDAVVIANGHYSVPYVPRVNGLEAYLSKFPGRVMHSKYYRSPSAYIGKKVVIIGNSASGHDVTNELVSSAHLPVYQSRRSKSRWDGKEPPLGIEWKPVIKEYRLDGRIVFDDDTYLDDIDYVIYCTGYQPSFPFWNTEANGRPLWDYKAQKLINGYWHTFFQDFPTLGIVGMPHVLTFRSFEYQAIALARLFSKRNQTSLPPLEEQRRWEIERLKECRKVGKKFHTIEWETGETMGWLDGLFKIAGLGTIRGEGRIPPVLGEQLIWAVEHIKKYPEPSKGDDGGKSEEQRKGPADEFGWVLVAGPKVPKQDLLAFI